MSRSRWRRRLAITAAVLVAVMLAIAAAVWIWRDLPRRKVQSELAELFSADVALGAFTIDGTQRFVLNDLVVTRLVGQNRLRRLSVSTLVVEGRATDILEGRFASIDASGAEAVFGPPDPSIPERTDPVGEIAVGQFHLSEARVVFEGGGVEGVADVEADLTGIGADLTGEVRATSDRLALAAGGFDLENRAVVATATFAAGASAVAIAAQASELVAHREGRRAIFPQPTMEAGLTSIDGGRRTEFTAIASAVGIESVDVSGTFDTEAGRLIDADAVVRGVDVAPAMPLVGDTLEGVTASGRVDAIAQLAQGEPLRWSTRAILDVLEAPDRLRAEGLDLFIEGQADAESWEGPIRATLAVQGVSGAVAGVELPATLAPIAATFEGRAAITEDPSVKGRLTLHNGLTGRLTADIQAEALASAPAISASWRLDSTALRGILPEMPGVNGSLSAEGLSAWPASRGALMRGRLRVEGLFAAVDDTARLEGGTLTAALTWPAANSPVSISNLDLSAELDVPPVPRAPIRVTGAAVFDPKVPAVSDGRFDISSEGLFAAVATGNWSATSGGVFDLALTDIDLSRWQDFLRPWIGDPAPGFSVNGSLTASITGEITPDVAWRGGGTATIVKSGFASDDGARVLEGLDTSWDVTLEGRALASGSAQGTARVDGFQVLWGSFFADAAALPSTVEARGSFDTAVTDGPAWTGALAWRYPEGPELDVSASGAGSRPVTYAMGLAIADLESTLATYLRAPLGDSIPWFTKIEGAGSVRVEARGAIDDDVFSAAGRARVEDARLGGTEGSIEVEGLDLDLPFDLRWGAPDASGERTPTGPPLTGSLGFRTLELGGLDLAETSTRLNIKADTIAFDESLTIPLFGGTLGLEKLTLIEALRPTRRAETAIAVKGLRLEEAAATFELPTLQGAVDGYFPAVTLQGSSFEVAGGGQVAVFGGQVKIGDISGEDILTRFPKLRLSADFEGIDLEQVTGLIDFGEITGIVRGYVHDLELFRGVPTRFDARLETVPTKGVSNRVHVKAVNNIAIIGTGGGGLINRGLLKFVQRFTYDRIGVELTLANDAFLLRGLERRGKKELFIKGRFPFPIDVVNAQPGSTVSFRTMLERLRSVDMSDATTQ